MSIFQFACTGCLLGSVGTKGMIGGSLVEAYYVKLPGCSMGKVFSACLNCLTTA